MSEIYDTIVLLNVGDQVEVEYDPSFSDRLRTSLLLTAERFDSIDPPVEIEVEASHSSGEEYKLVTPNTLKKKSGDSYRRVGYITSAEVVERAPSESQDDSQDELQDDETAEVEAEDSDSPYEEIEGVMVGSVRLDRGDSVEMVVRRDGEERLVCGSNVPTLYKLVRVDDDC